jgi:hypothetical protein
MSKFRIIGFVVLALIFMYCVAFAYVKATEAEHYSGLMNKMNEENVELKKQLDECQSTSAELEVK